MLNSTDLDLLEKNRQKESDWILEKTNLISILNKYGEVHIVGAKAVGLMCARDIDISVVLNEVNYETWTKLATELMVTPHIRRLLTIDDFNYDEDNLYDPTKGKKLSLFIALEKILGSDNDRDKTWEVQIHLIDKTKFDPKLSEDIKSKLTTDKRISILRLKNWAEGANGKLRNKVGDNFKINSSYIYKAVLDNGFHNILAFVKYFEKFVPEKYKAVFLESIKDDSASDIQ